MKNVRTLVCLSIIAFLNLTGLRATHSEENTLINWFNELQRIQNLDWPSGYNIKDPSEDCKKLSSQINRIRTTLSDFQCGSYGIKAKLLDVKKVKNDYWIQLLDPSNQKKSLNITEMERKTGEPLIIDDGLWLSASKDPKKKSAVKCFEFVENSISRYLKDYERVTSPEYIEKQKMLAANRAKRANGGYKADSSLLEDANPGQDSRFFDQVLNFPEDFEGKELRWLGNFEGMRKRGPFCLELDFPLKSQRVTAFSDTPFRLSDAMAKEITRHGINKGVTLRVRFKVSKEEGFGPIFDVNEIWFWLSYSNASEAEEMHFEQLKSNVPTSKKIQRVFITSDGKTAYKRAEPYER